MRRRLASAVAPGGVNLTRDRMVSGIVIGLAAWIAVAGIGVWVPRFLAVIEPSMPVQPVVVLLGCILAVAWLLSVASAWQRR